MSIRVFVLILGSQYCSIHELCSVLSSYNNTLVWYAYRVERAVVLVRSWSSFVRSLSHRMRATALNTGRWPQRDAGLPPWGSLTATSPPAEEEKPGVKDESEHREEVCKERTDDAHW